MSQWYQRMCALFVGLFWVGATSAQIVTHEFPEVSAESYLKEYIGAVAIVRDRFIDEKYRPSKPWLWAQGKYSCTGFHLGGGLVITAGHCTGTDLTQISFEWGVSSEMPWDPSKGQLLPRMVSRAVLDVGHSVDPGVSDYRAFMVKPIPPVSLPYSMFRVPVENDRVFAMGSVYGGAVGVTKVAALHKVPSCAAEATAKMYRLPIQEGQEGAPLISAVDGMVLGVVNSDYEATLLRCLPKLRR